jgi:hypothetical protein
VVCSVMVVIIVEYIARGRRKVNEERWLKGGRERERGEEEGWRRERGREREKGERRM